jgi:predicted RNA-binding Zn ribbon-like protein
VTAAPELPLLGEPPSVELANTLYGQPAADLLADTRAPRAWAEQVLPGLAVPTASGWAADLVALRDAVRRLLLAAAEARPAAQRDLAVVNRWAAAAPLVRGVVNGEGGPIGRAGRSGPAHHVLLATVADDCARVLAGAGRHPVRQCTAPGCTMLFVRRHHRRRWCHDGCGHRVRQAAYHRRRPPGRTG